MSDIIQEQDVPIEAATDYDEFEDIPEIIHNCVCGNNYPCPCKCHIKNEEIEEDEGIIIEED